MGSHSSTRERPKSRANASSPSCTDFPLSVAVVEPRFTRLSGRYAIHHLIAGLPGILGTATGQPLRNSPTTFESFRQQSMNHCLTLHTSLLPHSHSAERSAAFALQKQPKQKHNQQTLLHAGLWGPVFFSHGVFAHRNRIEEALLVIGQNAVAHNEGLGALGSTAGLLGQIVPTHEDVPSRHIFCHCKRTRNAS